MKTCNLNSQTKTGGLIKFHFVKTISKFKFGNCHFTILAIYAQLASC